MKYKMKLIDRFNIVNALPKQGTHAKMRQAQDLDALLSPSAEEVQTKQIKPSPNHILTEPLDSIESLQY